MNRHINKTWKKRGRKRAFSGGNPNKTSLLEERFGKGHIRRRDRRITRRINNKKRLPHG